MPAPNLAMSGNVAAIGHVFQLTDRSMDEPAALVLRKVGAREGSAGILIRPAAAT